MDVADRKQNTIITDRRAFSRVAIDTDQIKERRPGRPGRPPIDPLGRSERLSTRVCGETFDALCRLASQRGIELAEYVRLRLDAVALEDSSVAKNRHARNSRAS